MLLADSAQVADGKLYVLGGGWSITGPDPAPSAVAIKIEVERHEIGQPHHWELFLEDADGRPVMVGDEVPQPIEVRGEFAVGEPEGAPAGTPVDVPIAINFGPLPLPTDSRFTWRLTIDGETPVGAVVAFGTRPALEEELNDLTGKE